MILSIELKAPFPWFGGKSRAFREVSVVFGDVTTYCEPFAGSLGILLQRDPVNHEVVNDTDGWLVNFWRAVKAAPDAVAAWADSPVIEQDLHARHWWLLQRREVLSKMLEADPDAYDAKAAGWWVWGICAWIGSGWCGGNGPWSVTGAGEDATLVKAAGRGINRQIPRMGDSGINRKLSHMRDAGQGSRDLITAWMRALSDRLRRVRVAAGDFMRVLSPCVLHVGRDTKAIAGVLLDPPYPSGFDQAACYAGSASHATEVYQCAIDWALSVADNPRYRIVACGYDGLWTPPDGWTTRQWRNTAGYRREKGQRQEVLWCSPHCVPPSNDLVN